MRKYSIQMHDSATKEAIITSGGKVFVAGNGLATKVTLYNEDGSAKTNPITPTNGKIEFYTADTVAKVDLYGYAPSGHAIVLKNVQPSGPSALFVDKSRADTTLIVPYSSTDQTGDATETRTGFVLPGAVQPNVGITVTTVDATETIEVGTLSTDSGDADGFIDALSVATAGYNKATNVNGSVTLGVLLYVQDSANAGDDFPEQNTSMIGKEVTYTLTTGADTAAGFIHLPINLPATAL